jgi:hypothetical protein
LFAAGVDFSNFLIRPKQKAMSVLKELSDKYAYHSLLGPEELSSFPQIDPGQKPQSIALEESQKPKNSVQNNKNEVVVFVQPLGSDSQFEIQLDLNNKLAVREFFGLYTADSIIEIPKDAVINRAAMSAVRNTASSQLFAAAHCLLAAEDRRDVWLPGDYAAESERASVAEAATAAAGLAAAAGQAWTVDGVCWRQAERQS